VSRTFPICRRGVAVQGAAKASPVFSKAFGLPPKAFVFLASLPGLFGYFITCSIDQSKASDFEVFDL
jgi:hypothetical protein